MRDEQNELEVDDLATIIGNVVIDYEDTGPHSQRAITIRDTCAHWPKSIAGEVQAAGFRRPTHEPSDTDLIAWHVEQVEALRPFRRSSTHLKAAMMHAATVRALRNAEPQGEPSDALTEKDLYELPTLSLVCRSWPNSHGPDMPEVYQKRGGWWLELTDRNSDVQESTGVIWSEHARFTLIHCAEVRGEGR